MYFKQIDEIINGSKCQTRRVCKPNETLLIDGYDAPTVVTTSVYSYTSVDWLGQASTFNGHKDRIKWQVGRDYAVSPGRGKPGVWWNALKMDYTDDSSRIKQFVDVPIAHDWQPLRIVITAIRREPLQAISEADAVAEGITTMKWDPQKAAVTAVAAYRELWESINGRGSWDKNPEVFVIEFTVKK